MPLILGFFLPTAAASWELSLAILCALCEQNPFAFFLFLFLYSPSGYINMAMFGTGL